MLQEIWTALSNQSISFGFIVVRCTLILHWSWIISNNGI
jgi:hypothetical protein